MKRLVHIRTCTFVYVNIIRLPSSVQINSSFFRIKPESNVDMQSSDERVKAGRRAARFKILGFGAIFCVAGIGSIVASVLVMIKDKDMDEKEKRKVEIAQYGGICGGVLAMCNAFVFFYVLMKIPNTDGLKQMMTKQCYFIIALLLPYVGGAVGIYLVAKPFEDEKLQTLCYIIAGGFAIVVFSTISYLRFMWAFARAFGVQLCKGMEDASHKQSGRNDNTVYTIGMS